MNDLRNNLINMLAVDAAKQGRVIQTIQLFIECARANAAAPIDDLLVRYGHDLIEDYGGKETITNRYGAARLLAESAVEHDAIVSTCMTYLTTVAETSDRAEELIGRIGAEIMRHLAHHKWAPKAKLCQGQE